MTQTPAIIPADVSYSLSTGTVVSKITVSVHSVGPTFRGLVAAVAYFRRADDPLIPLCEDIFRLSYRESANEVANRFSAWLDKCLIDGLAAWRRTLI